MHTGATPPLSTVPARSELSGHVRRRGWSRWLRWTVGIVIGLAVLIVGGTSIYVHTITAPAPLTLPRVVSGPSSEATMDGDWKAGSGSIVGWRIQQVLFGQEAPLVGRTDKVWGSITVANGAVTQGSFSVDMAALTSSLSKTTRSTVFDPGAYPTGTLTLTSPIMVGAIPANSVVERFAATGTLALHGVTRPVHFTASVEGAGDSVYVLAAITIAYGNWGISAAGVPFLADLQSPAAFEVLLRLTQGAGNTPSVS